MRITGNVRYSDKYNINISAKIPAEIKFSNLDANSLLQTLLYKIFQENDFILHDRDIQKYESDKQ